MFTMVWMLFFLSRIFFFNWVQNLALLKSVCLISFICVIDTNVLSVSFPTSHIYCLQEFAM